MTTFNPTRLPHQKTGGSGRFVRMFASEAEVTMSQKSETEAGGVIQTKQGVLIPHQYLFWVILLMLGSGVGGPAINNIFARGVSQDAAAITEQGRLLTAMLDRLDKKIETISDHMDELDARMARIERADRATRETKQ